MLYKPKITYLLESNHKHLDKRNNSSKLKYFEIKVNKYRNT